MRRSELADMATTHKYYEYRSARVVQGSKGRGRETTQESHLNNTLEAQSPGSEEACVARRRTKVRVGHNQVWVPCVVLCSLFCSLAVGVWGSRRKTSAEVEVEVEVEGEGELKN